MNVWPPFLGAGIRVQHIAADWSEASVSMKLRFYNQNYVGTHFGGSLFALTDPFLMLLAINRLGADYVVWDKAAHVDFRKPGRGRVGSIIRMPDELVTQLRDGAAESKAHLQDLQVEVTDEVGDVVAVVTKTLYVRKKRERKRKPAQSDSDQS